MKPKLVILEELDREYNYAERFISQRDLARLADVSPTTVMQLETGQNPNPRLSTIRKLAEALVVEPSELVEHD